MLQPVKTAWTPVAQDEGHTSVDLPGLRLQVGAVAVGHGHCVCALGQSDSESCPLSSALLVVSSHCEGLGRVDGVGGPGAVVSLRVVCQYVDGAVATMVTVCVEAVRIGRWAPV